MPSDDSSQDRSCYTGDVLSDAAQLRRRLDAIPGVLGLRYGTEIGAPVSVRVRADADGPELRAAVAAVMRRRHYAVVAVACDPSLAARLAELRALRQVRDALR